MAKQSDDSWIWIGGAVALWFLYSRGYLDNLLSGFGLGTGPRIPPGMPGGRPGREPAWKPGDTMLVPSGQESTSLPPLPSNLVWYTPPVGNPPAPGTPVPYTVYLVGTTPRVDPRLVQGAPPWQPGIGVGIDPLIQ